MQLFDRKQFLSSLKGARDTLSKALELGEQLSTQGYQRLHFVGCGAPNRLLAFVQYWAQGKNLDLQIRTSYSAELVHYPPPDLDQHTLVLIASHSGTTGDTLEAARFLREKSCTTVALTQLADSSLAQQTDFTLAYGRTDQGYYAALMVVLAFFSSLVREQPGWDLHEPLRDSLPALPEALADVMEAENENTARIAGTLTKDRVLYLVGAGAASHVAYVFAACILMEMQWLHAISLNASEFFHGPFETIDKDTPVIVFLDESPNRPEAQRVADFCRRVTPRLTVFDSADYPLRGIRPEIRPMLSPFAADAALVRLAENLSNVRNHPLTTRRYMGKMEY
ncbi:MAG: SIS domain-containing protein [Anaerolineales bacterium]|nr:SIS domain-containing protein [Anaerolineales bacterium]